MTKMLKPDAHYIPLGLPFRQCWQCRFLEDGNKCTIVEGEIRPVAGCLFFVPKYLPLEFILNFGSWEL